MYDQIIRRFVLEGQVASSKIAGVRNTFAHHLKVQMKLEGYLPILDFDASWWVEYLPDKDAYKVRLVEQAIYYGKDDINQWDGWEVGELIPTTKTPLKTSSPPSDLT